MTCPTAPEARTPLGLPVQSNDIPRGITRRALLGYGAAAVVAGAAANSFLGSAGSASAAPLRSPLTRSLKDVKHVVVLMQENRSFDHLYGTLAGVRGFGDKQALEFPDGHSVFQQPDAARTDGGVMLPFHLDSAKFNAQNAGGLDHSWEGGHKAWNNGSWNGWVDAKSSQTMGYFTRDDIPFHFTLADNFTICDNYYSSLMGPTTPNRLFQWSGTIDPAGKAGGPATDNPADYNPVFSWGTYGEELQKANVAWKTYANQEVGDSGTHPYVGDYGDNPLWLFQQYHDSLGSSDPSTKQLAINGGLHDGWLPDSGLGLDTTHLLSEFIADCAANQLPQVSYVVAPYGWSEHPLASPDYGAHYTNTVIQALFSNQEVWESTVLLINYDENDGYFDHVVPPMPEAGTAEEFVDGLPIGLGVRVPLTVVSPWSRGGWVNSQVFDHTSVIRFLETWTGVKDKNISDWRRQVCGDLTTCFDFTKPDFSIPSLPDTTTLLAAADADRLKPPIQQPAPGAQAMPVQETAPRRHRPIPYGANANVTVDHGTGAVSLALSNSGSAAVSLAVYPNSHLPFQPTPFTVAGGGQRSYGWDASKTDGAYDFSVYGPNRFLRRFVGTIADQSRSGAAAIPQVSAVPAPGSAPRLRLTLGNSGGVAQSYTLTANDFSSQTEQVSVGAGKTRTVDWPTVDGYYDVIVTADGGAGFSYRFAGHLG